MTVVIGGKVSYSRTVRPADFESKNALVELTFEGDEEHIEDVLLVRARDAVLRTLGLAPAPAAAAEPAKAPRGRKPPTQLAGLTADVEAKKAADAAVAIDTPQIRANPEDRKDPAEVTDADVKRKPTDAELEIPAALKRTEEKTDSLDDILGVEAPTEISDADLTAKVTQKNAAIKNPIAIKNLVKKFVGDPPRGLRDIPKEKRADFLVELAAL